MFEDIPYEGLVRFPHPTSSYWIGVTGAALCELAGLPLWSFDERACIEKNYDLLIQLADEKRELQISTGLVYIINGDIPGQRL